MCSILAVQRQDGFPRLYFSYFAVSLPSLSLFQFSSYVTFPLEAVSLCSQDL